MKVLLALAQARNEKAAGIDNIPTEVFQNDVTSSLLYKTSGYFALGQVPFEWTTRINNPILKPGASDNRFPLNYRGIISMSVPYKIYCTVINNRLNKWLEENDCLFN